MSNQYNTGTTGVDGVTGLPGNTGAEGVVNLFDHIDWDAYAAAQQRELQAMEASKSFLQTIVSHAKRFITN